MRAPLIGLVVVALLAVSGCDYNLGGGGGGTNYSAILSTAIGVYPNADVRVLGVPVGKVDAVTPRGDVVRVDFHVDSDVQVPADAKAAVVAPTVIADRYLQLSPVYTGGPTMSAGTVIPKERTASPAEFDDLLASAQKLSRALGPPGVNANGALSQALTTAARNLENNGQQLNTTLDNTSQAITTLSASRENLAATTRNLQSFITNLKRDDGQVRAFTQQFAQVNSFLAGERQNLGETLDELSRALGEVARFVHDNRSEIRDNVDQLSDVLSTINDERLALNQVLETAAPGLDGLVNIYNAATGTVDTRGNLLGVLFCTVFTQLGPLKPVFGAAINALFPGVLAPCGGPTALATAASPIKLSPDTVAKLSDPKVLSELSQLAGGRASGSGRPSNPPDTRSKTLGELLGGGR